MNRARAFFCQCNSPRWLRAIHGWLTVLWLIVALPICIYLKESVAFLVFVSVYAVVVGHWSSWQATRVEVKQEEQAS